MSLNHPFSPYQTPPPQAPRVMSEVYRHARCLVETFPDKAIEFLAHQCDFNMVAHCLQEACDRRQLDYHAVLSSVGSVSGFQSYPPRTPQGPQGSRRPTLTDGRDRPTRPYSPPSSSQASSPILTSPLTQLALTNEVELIHVFNLNHDPKKFNMRSDPQSYSLICEDSVRDRLRLSPEALQSPLPFRYNDAHLEASHIVSLTWMRTNSKRTHETTFVVVRSDLLDVDLLIGSLRAEDLLANAGRGTYHEYLPD